MKQIKIKLAYKDMVNRNGWCLPYEELRQAVDEFFKHPLAELPILNEYKYRNKELNQEDIVIGKVKSMHIDPYDSEALIEIDDDIDITNKLLFLAYMGEFIKKEGYNEMKLIKICHGVLKDESESSYRQ